MCTDPVLKGGGQGGYELGAHTASGDLRDPDESFVASPACRRELPCPHGPTPVDGAQALAANGREPRAGEENEAHKPPSTSIVSKIIAARRTESPISFKSLESTAGPRGTKAEQHKLSAHSQRHTSKLVLKSLLDRTCNHPGAMDVKAGPTRRSSRGAPQTRP